MSTDVKPAMRRAVAHTANATFLEEDLSWQMHAECKEHDPELWFPVGHRVPTEAIKICRRCPVQIECLRYAFDKQFEGVWGGYTPEARKALRRKRQRLSCPNCRAYDIRTITTERGGQQVCGSCGMSWVF